jgi:hypothetical protein
MRVRPTTTCSVADPDGGYRLVFEEEISVDLPAEKVKKLRKTYPWLFEPDEAKKSGSGPVQQATAAPGEKRASSR